MYAQNRNLFWPGRGERGDGGGKKEEEINEIFRKFLNVKVIHVKTMRRGEWAVFGAIFPSVSFYSIIRLQPSRFSKVNCALTPKFKLTYIYIFSFHKWCSGIDGLNMDDIPHSYIWLAVQICSKLYSQAKPAKLLALFHSRLLIF